MIEQWNRDCKAAESDEAVKALIADGGTLNYAQIDEADNPLLHPLFQSSIQIINSGSQPILLLKGQGYLYFQNSQYSRAHEIFVKRNGKDFKNKKAHAVTGGINFNIPYPLPDATGKRSLDSVLLNPGVSVEDDFGLVGGEFEFDKSTAATYSIRALVKVCVLPTLEQVELTTDEIKISITDEHIRQYKSRQPPPRE